MLIKLLPDQIASHWSVLGPIIKVSLPPMLRDENGMRDLLQAAIEGKIRCWIVKDQNSIYAVISTTVTLDPITKVKNFLIYSFSGVKFIPEPLWKETLAGIRKLAHDLGCKAIVAYTSSDRIKSIVKELGGDISTTLVVLEV